MMTPGLWERKRAYKDQTRSFIHFSSVGLIFHEDLILPEVKKKNNEEFVTLLKSTPIYHDGGIDWLFGKKKECVFFPEN